MTTTTSAPWKNQSHRIPGSSASAIPHLRDTYAHLGSCLVLPDELGMSHPDADAGETRDAQEWRSEPPKEQQDRASDTPRPRPLHVSMLPPCETRGKASWFQTWPTTLQPRCRPTRWLEGGSVSQWLPLGPRMPAGECGDGKDGDSDAKKHRHEPHIALVHTHVRRDGRCREQRLGAGIVHCDALGRS